MNQLDIESLIPEEETMNSLELFDGEKLAKSIFDYSVVNALPANLDTLNALHTISRLRIWTRELQEIYDRYKSNTSPVMKPKGPGRKRLMAFRPYAISRRAAFL